MSKLMSKLEEIKNLPKKYFQITDEHKRDRMVAYVRLDEVMGIVNRDTEIKPKYEVPEDYPLPV